MKQLIIIHNSEPIFEEIHHHWRSEHPDREIRSVTSKEFAQLDSNAINANETGVFIAMANTHLNSVRLEFIFRLAQRGLIAESFISKFAKVPPVFRPGTNSYIAPGTVIEAGAKIGNNVFLGAYSHIGFNSVIKNSVWIGRKTQLGQSVGIGSNVVIDDNILIESQVKIGSYVCIENRSKIYEDIPDKTFFLKAFPNDLKIR